MLKKIINPLLISTVIISTLYLVVYYFISVDKGFNFLDEGFYLLSGANPTDVEKQLTSSYQYLYLLMQLSNNIVFLRLFNWILYISAIGFLTSACLRILPKNIINRKIVSLLMFCSTMTVCALIMMYPAEPSYNSLTVSGTVVFYSLIVYFFTTTDARYNNFFAFALGIVDIFVFFNKFTTGIILIILSFFACRAYKNAIKYKLLNQNELFLILGLVTHLVIYFSFIQSPQQYFKIYQAGFESMHIVQSNHSIGLLKQYLHQLSSLLSTSLKKYQLVIYASIILFFLRKNCSPAIRKMFSYLLLILFFILTYKIDTHWGVTRFKGLVSFYFSAIILMLFLWRFNYELASIKRVALQPLLLVILLFLLPLIIAMGTNNSLPMQMLWGCFVWIPIIVFTTCIISKVLGETFIYFTIAGISMLSSYYAIYNMREMPYGLYGNLLAQTHLVKVNKTQLHVDLTTKYIIENTRKQLKNCGFQSQNYLVSLTDLPGLTYAVNARSPSCVWYYGLYEGSDKHTQFCLSLFKKNISPYILLAHHKTQKTGFSEYELENYFKNFSARYALCGEVKNIPIPDSDGACCKTTITSIKIFKPVA